MRYYKQLLTDHDLPNGKAGDCYRTAIACILDKSPEEVPHVFSLEDDSLQSREMDKYLKSIGHRKIHIAFTIPTLKEMLAYGLHSVPDMYWILSGTSKRGNNHAIVCYNDKMIHDPHPCNEFISECCNDGFWHVDIIVKPI